MTTLDLDRPDAALGAGPGPDLGTASEAIVDVRALPCPERRATVFSRFDGLVTGGSFQFINDHDPAGLRPQLALRSDQGFGWDYVERGPEVWRVRVTRA